MSNYLKWVIFLRIPYRELYFQSYPIGLASYSLFAALIGVFVPMQIFHKIYPNASMIYLALFVVALVLNIKTRKDVCAYYGAYRNNRFSKSLYRSFKEGNSYSTGALMFVSVLSYILFISPIFAGLYYFLFFPFDAFIFILFLVYILVVFLPLVKIRNEFVSGFCEFPAKPKN